MLSKPTLVAAINSYIDLLHIYRTTLEQAGHKTVLLHDSEAGPDKEHLIEFLDRHEPDVVIYDVPPPYDTNYSLFTKVRERFSGRDLQFLVATTSAEAVERLSESQPVAILAKPFDLDEVVLAVNRLLDRRTTL